MQRLFIGPNSNLTEEGIRKFYNEHPVATAHGVYIMEDDGIPFILCMFHCDCDCHGMLFNWFSLEDGNRWDDPFKQEKIIPDLIELAKQRKLFHCYITEFPEFIKSMLTRRVWEDHAGL